MKKIISFATLFLGIAIFSIAQNNITFSYKSQNGRIVEHDADTYCMSFIISGLNTEAEVNAFTKTIRSNPIVKKFLIFPKNDDQKELKASLILISKEKEDFINLLKSANVNTLNVDNKDYTLDKIDQLDVDLKAKMKNNVNEEQRIRR
jgi:hypothetical protein